MKTIMMAATVLLKKVDFHIISDSLFNTVVVSKLIWGNT